ncbi:NigD-like C-terminal domain-containing protein [uncultured Alistipes sp.]|jgi:hypothetical protein|uniref:NigD1/NigD2 family lipoprotein n=1 Tax=uncultured Alistipes sp. TaxID=538949 RepID=UPI0025CEB831|nr:NigD-like C-terminal domain-containing protein [uncultured Alistipes sp.]
MKKLSLFLLVAFIAVSFSSCNDSDGDYAKSWAYVSVKQLANNDYYFVLDNSKTVYPGDKSRVPGYTPEEDKRVIILFNQLRTAAEGYDYNVALYSVLSVFKGETKIVTTEEELEELADDQTSLFLENSTFNSNYLNLGIGFNATDLSKHKFYLVRNDVTEVDAEHRKEGYLNLEFRHDADGDTNGFSHDNRYVSFDLEEFKADLQGKTGIIMRIQTRLNGVRYIELNLPKSE